MWKKAALNFLCNIGLFICLIAVYYGFNNKQYAIIPAGVFGAVVFVFFKVRLIKEVRNSNKKP